MIRIRTLIESSAAQKAKDMGLEAAPFGRWKKNGVITHRTNDQGELVPVKSKQASTVGGPKPTGTSAVQAGTAPSNIPGIDDVAKRQDAARKAVMSSAEKVHNKDVGGADGEQIPPTPSIPHNPFRPKDFHPPVKWGKIASSREEIDSHFNDVDPYYFRNEYVVGETVVIAEGGDQIRNIINLSDTLTEQDLQQLKKSGTHSARHQNTTFRATLSDNIFDTLIKVQNWWQESSQFERPEDERNQSNNFINAVCNHYKPTLKSEFPIERGMQIHAGDLEEFMSKIAIGKDIEMMPSGFSVNPKIARTFGRPSYDKAGVIIRIHPNEKGEIHGIHLTEVDVPEDKEDIRHQYDQTQYEYAHEQEIIRPSGCKARCINVTKVMAKPKDQFDKHLFGMSMYCLYIIDLEEQGYQDDLHESYDSDDIKNPIFDKYMNSSVGTNRIPHNTKLKNMVPSNEIA